MTDYWDVHTTFLPLIVNTTINSHKLGVQVDGNIYGTEQYIVGGRCYQSPYRWAAPDPWLSYNINIYRASANPYIIGTKTCPEAYRLWPDRPGSPPKPEHYIDYADDMEVIRSTVPTLGV